MAVIPNGQKFQTLSSNVDTTERRSALINSREATFTMADITETVNAGSGSSYLVYTGYITQSGTSAPTITTFENTTEHSFSITRFSAGEYEFALNAPTGVPGDGWMSIDNAVGVSPNNRIIVYELTSAGDNNTGFLLNSYGDDPAVKEDLNGQKVYFELRIYS